MKLNSMTLLALAIAFPLTLTSNAYASKDRGGGDVCENRIQVIANDFASWITQGGHESLKFPSGVASAQYKSSMLAAIQSTKVECVGKTIAADPVAINGVPKICQFDVVPGAARITCDFEKFRTLNEEEQYVLVHHEYAGVAGLERASGTVSHYNLSNQISAYLVETTVKKLAVNPPIDERSLCEKGIKRFIKKTFAFDDSTGEKRPIESVRVNKVEFIAESGMVDIEAHALFDEYGWLATRIFIEADGVWNTHPQSEDTPAGCKNFRVKASFQDALAD